MAFCSLPELLRNSGALEKIASSTADCYLSEIREIPIFFSLFIYFPISHASFNHHKKYLFSRSNLFGTTNMGLDIFILQNLMNK
jgi:hypothetical protein